MPIDGPYNMCTGEQDKASGQATNVGGLDGSHVLHSRSTQVGPGVETSNWFGILVQSAPDRFEVNSDLALDIGGFDKGSLSTRQSEINKTLLPCLQRKNKSPKSTEQSIGIAQQDSVAAGKKFSIKAQGVSPRVISQPFQSESLVLAGENVLGQKDEVLVECLVKLG